ncbi:hypothetical protein EDC24_2902 [Aquisalibacillus elongatus]|uniref:Uncharacterized protein n=1 Tax=Aquisalibacillus elongatus TaxID=485577 RepID=A0A3N5BVZ7_9BACI|nr:hypothetical protein EDC24_2902 [Aquisalibacillus elongatus]
MNDKLWKVIQTSSGSTILIGGIILVLSLPKERKPSGGWEVEIPSVAFQITAINITSLIGFTFVFSSMVRRQKEVSLKVLLITFIYIICFGVFYLMLRSFRG